MDVVFFAFRARTNQACAKESENSSLYLKVEKSYAESLRALELNTCWEELIKIKHNNGNLSQKEQVGPNCQQ